MQCVIRWTAMIQYDALLRMGRDMNRGYKYYKCKDIPSHFGQFTYKYYKCKEIASDFGQFTLVNVVQEEVMTFRTISTANYIEIVVKATKVLNLLKLLWSFEHFPFGFYLFLSVVF
eukprot:661340_1